MPRRFFCFRRRYSLLIDVGSKEQIIKASDPILSVTDQRGRKDEKQEKANK